LYPFKLYEKIEVDTIKSTIRKYFKLGN